MVTADQIIGPYNLLKPLGRGGMGVVHKAQHRETGKVVALKTIRVADEMQLEGIRREVRALARLNHPGIVKIVAEGVQDGLPWYAMEFLQGVTLRHYFSQQYVPATEQQNVTGKEEITGHEGWTSSLGKKEPPAPTAPTLELDDASEDQTGPVTGAPPQALSGSMKGELSRCLPLVRRLCQPLAFLHGEGIVHRDLKPDNIMVTDDDMPVLVDFGLMTQFTGEESREILFVEHGGAGTVHYMAPEQIKGEFVDARTDLYALGCILYELLVGHPPFVGVNIAQIFQAHLQGTPVSPSHFRAEVPPQVDDLVSRLLAKDPRERVGHADVVATTLAQFGGDMIVIEDPKPRTYLYRSSFAGRDPHLSQLREHQQRLLRGKGSFVLVGGESGVGKTRLVMEFGREAARQNIQVLTGECTDRTGNTFEVFQKPLQAIADRCRERGLEETERLLGRRGKILALHEPSLASLPGQKAYPDPVELKPDEAMIRLFSYFSEMLRELARDEPLLIILDDLQWVDNLTVGFFEFILRTQHLDRSRIQIVGTYRSEEVSAGLQKILDTGGVDKVDLSRLDQESVSTMVSDMLAMRPSPQLFCRYLSRHSEGNPLFVAEYLRTAVEECILWRDSVGRWQIEDDTDKTVSGEAMYHTLPLPRSLQGLIERRLHRLSAIAQRLINSSAIVGRESNRLLLRQTTGLDDETMNDTIEELLHYQILEQPAPDTVRFVHDKIREVALSRLEENEKQELHHLTAQAIESLYQHDLSTNYGALAWHYEKAEISEKAREYLEKAAEYAKEKFAHETALSYFDRLLKYSDDKKKIIDIYYKKARIFQSLGKLDEAINILKKGVELAQEINNTQSEANVTILLGDIFSNKSDFESALSILADAEKICDRENYAYALNIIGHIYFRKYCLDNNTSFCDRAYEHYQKSIAVSEEIGDKQRISSSLNCIGLIYERKGASDRALEYYEKSLAIAEEIGAQLAMSYALNNIGLLHSKKGAYDKALECYHRSLAIKEEIGDKRGIPLTLNNMGIINMNRGSYDKALDYYHQTLASLEEMGDKPRISGTLCNIGIIYLIHKGAYEEALEYYYKSLAIKEEIGDKGGLGYVYAYLAYTYIKSGQIKKASEIALLHFRNMQEIGIDVERGRTHLALALILKDYGSSFRNEEELGALKHILQKITTITELPETAAAYFEKAIENARKDDYLETLIPALYEYGKYLITSKNEELGISNLKEAQEKAIEAGMIEEIRIIEELCQELGIHKFQRC
ncbi:tetratricopeptide repeat protein [candidate division CSSED10-310 bacterium]|uniref:Tetratricopeptide repeat protein n=1 Tax=candidate division CSSED10-310 bacterium TaxID=2855610 RepID=A0ABV6Z4P0_UNCC1